MPKHSSPPAASAGTGHHSCPVCGALSVVVEGGGTVVVFVVTVVVPDVPTVVSVTVVVVVVSAISPS